MLSRAYVITVVGLSADNICRWAWPLYSNPTLLVFIPHTWSVPNAPPLGWSPGIESMGRGFECGCTVGVAGVCPALPKMSRDSVPSGTGYVCCVYLALLPYFLCFGVIIRIRIIAYTYIMRACCRIASARVRVITTRRCLISFVSASWRVFRPCRSRQSRLTCLSPAP